MENKKLSFFIGTYADYFYPQDLISIKEKLEKMDDEHFYIVQNTELRNPSVIIILAVFGLERFFLKDIGLGFLKIISMFFLIGLIWVIIDIFSATDRAKKYNFKQINKTMALLQLL